MASDLDTVRVLRALYNDMPRPPQGLSPGEHMAWVQRTMKDFEGGEMAYTLECITRDSTMDIVLRLREDGYLKDDKAFEDTLTQISTPDGRRQFQEWVINAQKSVDATSRLLNRAKRSWSEPAPLFVARKEEVQRFVKHHPTGRGCLMDDYLGREDVKGIGMLDPNELPGDVYEFEWGFVIESQGTWDVYVAEVWDRGTVGYFDRMMSAWRMELHPPGFPAPHVPLGLSADVGIGAFCAISLHWSPAQVDAGMRRWVGEVFITHWLPIMAARAIDPDYDFPSEFVEPL